jgi:hypothetical protein
VKLYTLAIAADVHLQMGELSPGIDWLAFAVSQTGLYGIQRVYAKELFAQWQVKLDVTQLDAIIRHAAGQSGSASGRTKDGFPYSLCA